MAAGYHYCGEPVCLTSIPAERHYCPKHELHYADEQPQEHVHAFIIPVEWAYAWARPDGSREMAFGNHPCYKQVTKLRCSCGEEEARG